MTVEVSKQVDYVLGSADLQVSKQVGYTLSAYPYIDISKQVVYPLLADPELQVAKQVVYALLASTVPGGGQTITTNSVVQIECGTVEVTGTTPSTITGIVNIPLDVATSPDDPTPKPIPAGEWGLLNKQQIITGLDHLEGRVVWALADGQVVGPMTVSGGSVDLGFAAANWIVGLLYSSQFQTLRLDTGEPTIQGRRKIIPAVTLRLKCSVGMLVGTQNFLDDMYQPKSQPLLDYGYQAYTQGGPPAQPFTGDIRVNVGDAWSESGTITIQQNYPLPLTILGLIPEVTVGDTQR